MLVSSILIVWPVKECHMLHFGMPQYLKGIRFRAKTHMSHMLVQSTLYCYQETTCGLTNTALLTLQDDNNGALAMTMALEQPDIMAEKFFLLTLKPSPKLLYGLQISKPLGHLKRATYQVKSCGLCIPWLRDVQPDLLIAWLPIKEPVIQTLLHLTFFEHLARPFLPIYCCFFASQGLLDSS